MFSSRRHDEPDLLVFPYCAELYWLVENSSSKNIAVTGSRSYPHQFRTKFCKPRTAIVYDHLEIVRMLWQELPLKFWLSAPVHYKCPPTRVKMIPLTFPLLKDNRVTK